MSSLERESMPEEKQLLEPAKNTSDFLDVITGKVGKITLLLTTVAGLLTGVNQLFQIVPNPFKFNPPAVVEPKSTTPGVSVVSKPTALEDCFKPKMVVEPDTVSISKWESMILKLTGRNDCIKSLGVHVAFKMASDRVRIMSPVGDCSTFTDSACWQTASIDSGALNQTVTTPRLYPLSNPLGNPLKLNINWMVYNADDQKLLRTEMVQITLRDDP
jgi:hypothetical protein